MKRSDQVKYLEDQLRVAVYENELLKLENEELKKKLELTKQSLINRIWSSWTK